MKTIFTLTPLFCHYVNLHRTVLLYSFRFKLCVHKNKSSQFLFRRQMSSVYQSITLSLWCFPEKRRKNLLKNSL